MQTPLLLDGEAEAARGGEGEAEEHTGVAREGEVVGEGEAEEARSAALG